MRAVTAPTATTGSPAPKPAPSPAPPDPTSSLEPKPQPSPAPPNASKPSQFTPNQATDDLFRIIKQASSDFVAATKPGVYHPPTDKEKALLAGALVKAANNPAAAQALLDAMETYKDDPMVQKIGMAQFLGLVAAANQRIAEKKAQDPNFSDYGMTAIEKAALMGYTGGDYTWVNPALRGRPLLPTDVDAAKSYGQHVADALAKLPAFHQPEGQPDNLYRAVFPAQNGGNNDWAKAAYQPGNVWGDDGVMSTGRTMPSGGEYNIVIDDASVGRDVKDFSMWPGEGGGEVTVPPGTQFDVVSVDQTTKPPTITLHPRPRSPIAL